MADMFDALDGIFNVVPDAAFTADSKPGDTVTGFVESMKLAQAFDAENRRPATWDDGRPQMNFVLTLAKDNDELTTIYIKTWGVQRKALVEAVKKAGGQKITDVLSEGSRFTATYTGDEKSTVRGQNDTKLYTYEIG